MRNLQMLIVSAVKICKQSLQTASSFWGPRSPTGGRGTGGLAFPGPMGHSPSPNENSLRHHWECYGESVALWRHFYSTWQCCALY